MSSEVLGGKIPFSVMFLNKHLFPVEPKMFGCSCFVRDSQPHINKLDPKSLKCVFLGYSCLQKGYTSFSPILKRYLVSRDVTFKEKVPFFPMTTSYDRRGDDDLLVYTIYRFLNRL